MNKIIHSVWYPNKKTLNKFEIGGYIFLAPILILNFILPGAIVLGCFLLFFVLKLIVTLRAAITHEVDEEKWKKYFGNESIAKRAYKIFSIAIACFFLGIFFFFTKTEGILGVILTVLIASLTLPKFFKELIIIKRCQREEKR